MNKIEKRLDELLTIATKQKALLENPQLVQVSFVITALRNTLKGIRKQALKCEFTVIEIHESLQEFIPEIPKWNPHSKKKNPQWKTGWN